MSLRRNKLLSGPDKTLVYSVFAVLYRDHKIKATAACVEELWIYLSWFGGFRADISCPCADDALILSGGILRARVAPGNIRRPPPSRHPEMFINSCPLRDRSRFRSVRRIKTCHRSTPRSVFSLWASRMEPSSGCFIATTEREENLLRQLPRWVNQLLALYTP